MATLDPPPVPVSAPVSSGSLDYAADATISAEVAPGPAVLASALSGTVTKIAARAGEPVHTGEPIYSVDGVPVVGYSDGAVLYRPLELGATGPDVKTAQRLLASLLGQSLDDDGTFDAETRDAVRAYEKRIGHSPSGVLNPAWFTRLPKDPFLVENVNAQLGASAPSTGEAILTGAATATGFSLTTESRGPAGAYEFVSHGQTVAVERDATGWTFDDSDEAAALVLTGDVTGTTANLGGRVRLANPVEGQAVPGAAIVTDAAGATCVVLAADRKPRLVEVVGAGADGTARIGTTLDEGDQVLLNPLMIVGDVTCPSR
ncbi:peptidoglycan-binding protein [Cellulomonas sp. PhB150]|uniref:peptidoglycan-binding protein n=1 Tax=Cellulomonas sp. PhB150 TaxID=2485188 RepID=UPI0013157506|nr:peptidoglycan-binding protein [Cellulomonas sp. PhB150]